MTNNAQRLLKGKAILVDGVTLLDACKKAQIVSYRARDGRHLIIHNKGNDWYEAILVPPLDKIRVV